MKRLEKLIPGAEYPKTWADAVKQGAFTKKFVNDTIKRDQGGILYKTCPRCVRVLKMQKPAMFCPNCGAVVAVSTANPALQKMSQIASSAAQQSRQNLLGRRVYGRKVA
jgi:hypothetical protein